MSYRLNSFYNTWAIPEYLLLFLLLLLLLIILLLLFTSALMDFIICSMAKMMLIWSSLLFFLSLFHNSSPPLHDIYIYIYCFVQLSDGSLPDLVFFSSGGLSTQHISILPFSICAPDPENTILWEQSPSKHGWRCKASWDDPYSVCRYAQSWYRTCQYYTLWQCWLWLAPRDGLSWRWASLLALWR